MSKKNLVVQHNSIIEARYILSVEEQRLIKTLVSQINLSDEDFKTYSIRLIDLARLLGISESGYYSRIKKVTKKIMGNVISFTDFKGDDVQVAWLSSVIYRKGAGTIELRFDPVLKPYLIQLKSCFTSYELGNVLKLKGMYSIRIYELLKQYENLGAREFNLTDLREILKIGNEYQEYKYFKRSVLIPVQKEVSEKTDISFKFSEKKIGKNVVALFFSIKRNISLEEGKIIELAVQGQPEILLMDRLIKLGISQKAAEELAKEHDEARIMAAIAYTEAQQKEGKVKNPAGFLVEAIKDGYKDNQAEERDRKEKEKKARAEQEQAAKVAKDQYEKRKKQAIDTFLASLHPDQLAELRAEFTERHKSDPALMARFEKSGMDSALVKNCFRAFVFERRIAGQTGGS